MLRIAQIGMLGVFASVKRTEAASSPIWPPHRVAETREEMTERAIKINEKLATKGKLLEEMSHEEFDEIAHSVGLHRQKPK
jgi:hypothetical protein